MIGAADRHSTRDRCGASVLFRDRGDSAGFLILKLDFESLQKSPELFSTSRKRRAIRVSRSRRVSVFS